MKHFWGRSPAKHWLVAGAVAATIVIAAAADHEVVANAAATRGNVAHADGRAIPDGVAHIAARQAAYEGGRTACRRCHLSEYRSWQRTPHAGALEALPEGDRANPECLRCHTTGFGTASGFTSMESTPELAGIGCEACHGPGSLYKDEDTMKDRDASVAAGLLLPDEQTCRRCHNADSPTFPGSFDFEAMKAEGVHQLGR